jgi:hypothetical protein
MIIGELAPLLFHFTFQLLPVAFYLIPVHFSLLSGLIIELKILKLAPGMQTLLIPIL